MRPMVTRFDISTKLGKNFAKFDHRTFGYAQDVVLSF